MQPTRFTIQQHIENGDLEEAIDLYLQQARENNDAERIANGVLLSGRYSELVEQQQHGAISQENYSIERAQIRLAVLDFANDLPTNWKSKPVEAVSPERQVPPGSPATDRTPATWIAGVLLLLAIVIGWVWLGGTSQAQNEQKPIPAEKSNLPPAETQGIPQQSPTPGNTGKTQQPKFRSFGKQVIADGMERGYVGDRFAFRNVRTNSILCCYEEASDFSEGKALVKQDGASFYIDKNGNKVKK